MSDYRKFEAMAKLDLAEEERAALYGRMDDCLRAMDRVADIDATGVEPLVTVLDIQNVLREDIPSRSISREALLANAPAEYDGYFQVPRTLD